MARKRKQSRVVPTSAKHAKHHHHHHDPSLIGLPYELLETVLSYVLPDPAELKQSLNSGAANQLFIQPIAQTCQALRERCFHYINQHVVWVYVRLDAHTTAKFFDGDVSNFPFLSAQLFSHLSQTALKISIDIHRGKVGRKQGTRARERATIENSCTVVFPFNFDIVLRLFDMVSTMEIMQYATNPLYILSIQYENFIDHAEDKVHKLVRSAMCVLRNLGSVECLVDPTYSWSEEQVHPLAPGWQNIEALLSRATYTLQKAEEMERKGHIEEAGLILLQSEWIKPWMHKNLPAFPDWILDDLVTISQSPSDPRNTEVKKLGHANQLHGVLYHIDRVACVYLYFFLFKHGLNWCQQHNTRWGNPRMRFTCESIPFTWSGITKSELAKFDLGRAFTFELLGTIREGPWRVSLEDIREHPMNPGWWSDCLEIALIHANFAVQANPEDEECQRLRSRLITCVDSKTVATAQETMVRRMIDVSVPVRDEANESGTDSQHWRLEVDLFRAWGEQAGISRMPVHRWGVDLSPGLVEWCDKITPHYLGQRMNIDKEVSLTDASDSVISPSET